MGSRTVEQRCFRSLSHAETPVVPITKACAKPSTHQSRPKDDDWSPEPGDEPFVVESKGCFVTGISTEPPDEFNVHRLEPVRHGIPETMISNEDSVCMIDGMRCGRHPITFSLLGY